jgi:hypothetical protein
MAAAIPNDRAFRIVRVSANASSHSEFAKDRYSSWGEADLEDANCNSRLAEEKQDLGVRRFFIGALAVCALLSIALYNGYPTVFSDTGGYLLTGKYFLALPPFRAPGYALFTRLSSFGVSAWFTIAFQSVIVVYVLHAACDYLVDGDRKFADFCFLVGVFVLAGLTSLPWLVSLLMPDVFAGVLFLSAFLLAFADEMRPVHRILLAAILTISVATHTSLFPIAALFVVALLILKQLGRSWHCGVESPNEARFQAFAV